MTDAQPIRILIADDHTVVREGTRRIFEGSDEFEVVAEADNGETAVEAALRLRPDIALLDIRMPGMNGIEAAKRIREGSPATQILALTAYADEAYVARLLRAGASGYLLKTTRADDLRAAVRQAHRGEVVIDNDVARKMALASARGESIGRNEPELTPREMEVLDGLRKGLRNKEIARDLGLSVRTVEGHVEAIFARLGVNNRTEAAMFAARQGWFEEGDDAGDGL